MNAQTPPPSDGSRRFFDWIRSLGVVRGSDRWIGGVCSGVARRVGLDPLIVRGIAVVLFFLGGFGVFAYLIAWLLLPDGDGRIHVEQLLHGRATPLAWIGVILVAIVLIWPGPHWLWFGTGWRLGATGLATIFSAVWTLAVIGAVVWFIVWLTRRDRHDASSSHIAPPGSTPPGATPPGTTPAGTTPPGTTPADRGETVYGATPAGENTETSSDESDRDRPAQSPGQTYSAPRPTTTTPTPTSASTPTPTPTSAKSTRRSAAPGSAATAISTGLAVLVGVVTGLFATNIWPGPAATLLGLSAALAVLGASILTLGIFGRRGGVLTFFSIVLIVVTFVGIPFSGVRGNSAFTSQQWSVSPSSIGTGTTHDFRAVAATNQLDLSNLSDTNVSGEQFSVSVTASTLRLIVPETGAFRVSTQATASTIDVSSSLGDSASSAEGSGLSFQKDLLIRDGHVVTGTVSDASGAADIHIELVASTLRIVAATDVRN